MAKQTINIGSVPNDGTGSTLRDGGDLINDNFNEIYSAIGDGTTLTSGTFLTTTNSASVTNKTFNTTNTFPTITIGDDTSTNFAVSLGGSFEIVGGSGINTAIENNRIVLSTDGSIVTETSSDTLTNKTINAPDNTITNISNSNLSGTAGITNANLSTPYITIGDDTSTNFNVNLGGSFEIVGGSGMATAINNNRIELSLSNVPNASLQNSSFTLGSDTINLGDTTTTITGLSLDGTGTIDLTGSGSKARFNFAGFGSLPTAATYEGMFAYDTTGQRPYVADAGGWVRILDENSSVSSHADVNITGIADERILIWSSSQARFNAIPQKINGAAEIDVTNNGSSNYLFNSHYSGANPTLYFEGGATYALKLNVSGHPFHLQTVSGAYSSGNAYTTGLTHIATDGTVTTGASALLKETGTLYVEVPSGSSTTIYYACQYHSGMAGSIILQDNTAAAGASSGFAIAMSVAL
jgi:hypothetical protein